MLQLLERWKGGGARALQGWSPHLNRPIYTQKRRMQRSQGEVAFHPRTIEGPSGQNEWGGEWYRCHGCKRLNKAVAVCSPDPTGVVGLFKA